MEIINAITDQYTENFWGSLETVHKKKQEARDKGLKIIGAQGLPFGPIFTPFSFNMENQIAFAMNALALSLATASINESIKASAENVQEETPEFIFNTVEDGRVCPICTPLDGLIMSDQDGSLQTPPLHVKCRCFLIPVV